MHLGRLLGRAAATPLLLVLVPLPTESEQSASTLSIAHGGLGCVVAGRYPRFEVAVTPPAEVSRVKVVFRPVGTTPFYAVGMKPEGGVFTATLPKPKKSLAGIEYYIEAVDRAFGVARTSEYRADVVSRSIECQGKVMAGSAATASIILETPAGAPTIPAGFANAGVVTATGAATGGAGAAAAAATAASAAAAGGIGTTTLVVGGVAVAGAAAVVATKGNDRPPATLPPTATGHWSGTLFENDAGGQCTANWNLAMDLVESGAGFTGNMTCTGVSSTTGPLYQCYGWPGSVLGPGTVTGTISGDAVRWSFDFQQSPAYRATFIFDGTITADRKSMRGTWVWQGREAAEYGTWMAARQ